MLLDCVVLVMLVLIQLPKKEAGAGLAFGGAATDALFGAGSGNVLTKITKYAATTFFVMALILSVMQRVYHTRHISAFEADLQKTTLPLAAPAASSQPPSTPQTSPQTPATKPAAVPATNGLNVAQPPADDTNLPIVIPPTPAPATPAKK